eukprot:CAMPEP_0118956766 /NCGR_PEP_ID=MMETSP1169-20130426/61748_1 /TAXON_ID=36882 /ORGANISM="Pyramimonas obovata, Strain CCMP722" /LENGTH=395 /DNA_ID=CAMNT_0006904813 /DNA_START=676 /DNA_END=1861 /DNA_ORIENTATION=+
MEEAAMSDTATTASYFSKEEYARYVALIDEYFSEDCIAIMEAALEARFAKLVLDHPDLYSGEGPPRLVRRLRHNDPYLVQYLAKFIVILQEAVRVALALTWCDSDVQLNPDRHCLSVLMWAAGMIKLSKQLHGDDQAVPYSSIHDRIMEMWFSKAARYAEIRPHMVEAGRVLGLKYGKINGKIKLVLDHPDLYSGEGPPRLVRRLRHIDPYLPEGMTTLFVGGYGVIRNDQDMPDTLAMATFDEKTGTWRYIQGCIRALYDTVFPGLMHVDKGVVQKKVGMMDLIPLVVHQQTATKLKKGDQVGGNDLVLEHLKCKGLFEVLQVSIKIYTAHRHTLTPLRIGSLCVEKRLKPSAFVMSQVRFSLTIWTCPFAECPEAIWEAPGAIFGEVHCDPAG